MTSFARDERARLCDLALETGPDAPTLCGDWTVRELAAHLVLREHSPLAAGILLPPLAGITERATARKAATTSFERLVDRVRHPRSLMALPVLDSAVNTAELFVHHEDVRRATPGWRPRTLTEAEQDALWRVARVSGKGLVRAAGVPVVARRADTGAASTLRRGQDPVVVSGLPSELVLLLFGRRETHDLTYDGPPDRVARLRSADLGI